MTGPCASGRNLGPRPYDRTMVFGWWSAGELGSFIAVAIVGICVLWWNKRAARTMANLTSNRWPPGGLISEDRPERIQEQRELHQTAVAMFRVGAIVFGTAMVVMPIYAIVRGP